MNLTNFGIILGAVAVFFVIKKAVAYKSAINTLSSDNTQYASAYSDNYDWIQQHKSTDKVIYV